MTAMAKEPRWIGAPGNETPALAKRFSIRGDAVVRAVLRIAAPGFSEAWLDGCRVGDAVLDPAPTDYTKRVYYREYPLDLAPGEHELLVLLGHGWLDQRTVSAWRNHEDKWRAEPCLWAEMVAQTEKGGTAAVGAGDCATHFATRHLLVTDGTWRQMPSPLAWDDLREGEIVDPGFVLPRAGFVDGAPAVEVAGPAGALQRADFPPARVVRDILPIRVWRPKAGGWMFDFGEDIAGWARVTFRGGRRGDVATLRYDERVAPGGEPAVHVSRDGLPRRGNAILWPENARAIDCFHTAFGSDALFPSLGGGAAMQQDRFVIPGASGPDAQTLTCATYEPRFVYHGFRYLWVRGVESQPDAVAREVRTDFAERGIPSLGDPDIDALVAMADRAYKANFADGVPTDCPHREKNGWTGDAQIACEFGLLAYDNVPAYVKWCRDLADAQREDGNLPGIVPSGGWGFEERPGGLGYGPVWGGAVAIVPWTLWTMRGERTGLEICYDSMKRYAEYEESHLGSDGLVHHGLGDWISAGNYVGPEFVGTAYHHEVLRIIAETARLKGESDDAARFGALAARVWRDFNAAHAQGDGLYGSGGQTEQATVLELGLVPEADRPAAEARLVEAVHRAGDRFDGGLVGSKHVFRALSRAGRTDLALAMLKAKGCPGFLHWREAGGTALWEDWWTGASRNHVMFCDFAAWAIEFLSIFNNDPTP